MSDSAHAGQSQEVTVLERPPPGLPRGRVPVPAWVVLVLGAILVLLGAVYLARRLRHRGKP